MTEDKHPPCLALPWWLAPSLALATAAAPPPPPSNIQHLSACLPTLTQTQSTLYTTYTYTRAIYPGVPHLISAPSTLSGIPETGARSRSADSSWSRRAPAPSDVSWGQLACLVRLAARILFRTATPPPFHEQMMLLLVLLLKARHLPLLLPLRHLFLRRSPFSTCSWPSLHHHQHDELVGLGKAVWPGPAVVRSSREARPLEAGFILMYDRLPSPSPLLSLVHLPQFSCHMTIPLKPLPPSSKPPHPRTSRLTPYHRPI